MLTTVELKKKTKEDLGKMLSAHRSRLLELRFKLKANQVKDVREGRELKKDVARLLTALNSK